jgi:DNA-binding response OmpR family regulator
MPDTHRASRRVLVVDDNRDAAETLALLLRQRGHEVKLARDGEEAQVTASSFQPEAVILDIGLPGMDGFEVARRLRTDRAEDHFLLIAISGYGQDDDRRRAREVGFDHYFTKPVSFEALRDLLSGLSRGD